MTESSPSQKGPGPADDAEAGPPVDPLDDVWRALANPWRRHILDLVRDHPRTTGELAEACQGISRFAVMQHLGVLEEARLIIPRRAGRKRFNHLNPVPIQRIHERWVRKYEGNWAEALVGMKKTLEEGPEAAGSTAG